MTTAATVYAITVLRATRHSQRREEVPNRFDPDGDPVELEGYRSVYQLVVGTAHLWDDIECSVF